MRTFTGFSPRRLLAAFSVAALAASLVVAMPPPASAQGEPTPAAITLVKNTGQSVSALIPITNYSVAQGFTTGSNSGGYGLSSIGIRTSTNATEPDDVNLELWSATSSGQPNAKLFALTAPDNINWRPSLVSFVNPRSAFTLAPDTTYFVVVYTDASARWPLDAARSDAEDSDKAEGWSIANKLRRLNAPDPNNPGSQTWRDDNSNRQNSLKIAIKGSLRPPPPLVSNIAQRSPGSIRVDRTSQAQGFTTGTHDFGYTLRKIDAVAGAEISFEAGRALRAELWQDAETNKLEMVASLAVPTDAPIGRVSFEAPEGTILTPSTTYYLVVYTTDINRPVSFVATGSFDEDRFATPNWSIANEMRRQVNGSGTTGAPDPDGAWTRVSWGAMKLAVWGEPAPPPPLVSNVAPDDDAGTVGTGDRLFGSYAHAQGFTTGPHAAGYTLTSIQTRLDQAVTASQRDQLRAELWSAASSGGPGSRQASLEVPAGNLPKGRVSFAAPENTTLAAGTSYYLVLYTVDHTAVVFNLTTDLGPYEGTADGWSIEKKQWDQRVQTPQANSVWNSFDTEILQIGVTGAARPTVTLTSDDADNSVAESDGSVTLTATLSQPAASDGVTVRLTRDPASTAEAGPANDYRLPTSITIAAGDTTGTATLTIVDDSAVEADEKVILSAAAPGHGAGADLTIEITDDDTAAKPTGVTVSAADSGLNLSWTAPAGVLSGYDVHYTSASDTGAVPDDATVRSDTDDTAGWVDAGHTGLTASHSITGLTNDAPYRVRIRAQSAAGAGAWAHDAGTPEMPTVTLSSGAGNSVAESVGTVTITATLSQPAAPVGGVDVTLTKAGTGTATGATADYTLAGTINVPQGSTTGTASLTVVDDTAVEANETVVLGGDAVGHTAGADLEVTITDNDLAAQPAGVTVTAADTLLDLSWTAPEGVLTGYDVHYTSASDTATVPNEADVRNDSDDTAGWIDANHTGLSASHSITSLTNDTTYRVRMRAQSAAGAGAWRFDTGTPAVLSTVTLVTNLGQQRSSSAYGAAAQGFTTGSQAEGYPLANIEAVIGHTPTATQRDTIRAELWSAAATGAPKAKIVDLAVPPHPITQGTVSFAAPANTTLSADAKYFFRLYLSTGETWLDLTTTDADAEDAVRPADWTLDDTTYDLSGGSWVRSTGERALQVRVVGVASPNADLSDLTAASSSNSAGPFAALTLSPEMFDAATTSYTASVENSVTHVKLTPTVAHSGASVTVEGTTVTSGSASEAIALDEGDNELKVQVTAQDSVTTKDYTVTVTRAAAQDPPTALVSNLGQSPIANVTTDGAANAQTFTTGSNAGGYTLSSIDLSPINAYSSSEALRVELWSTDSSGVPSSKLASLRVPSSLTKDAESFAAPADTLLSANTTYAVVWHTGNHPTAEYSMNTTDANQEDDGKVDGWSIGNESRYRQFADGETEPSSDNWTRDIFQIVKIRVTGTAVPPLPTVTLSSDDADDNVAESVGTVTVTATLSEAATPAGGVTVTLTAETASTAEAGAGKDYTLAGTITIAQGATTGTATLTVNDDTVVEAHETLVLSATADGHTSGADLELTITDDDLAAQPTAVIVAASDSRLGLSWTAPNGVLTGYDVHYTSASDTVAVPDNAAVRTDSDDTAGWVDAAHTGTMASHSIGSLTNDTPYRIRVRAQSAAGAGAWTHDTGTPEAPTVTLSTDDADDNVAESVGTVTITATLSEAATPAGGVTVTLTAQSASTAEAGAAKDYTLAGTITIAQGSTTGTATLTVNDDSDVEAHETVVLSAAADGHTAGADLTVTISDDDTAAKPTGVTVTAADTQLDLTWTAPAGLLSGYDVHYTSASDTVAVPDDATVRTDSDDTAGWVDATHTGLTATHTITSLTNDTDYRIRIRATSAAGAGAWEHGTGTPEAPPLPTVTLSSDDADDNVAESAGTVTITATLSEAATPASGVTVTVTREAASTAEAGTGKDYTLAGTITVAQGATTGTATLTVNDDTDVEAHETLVLRAAADGHTAGADLAVTISDNDTAAKPTGVTVTAADTQLDLSWTAPAGLLTGYDVHYTSAPKSGDGSVTDDATVRTDSDDTAGWVDATHTGLTATHTITSLTNDTTYRVRIRAQSAAGSGAWEHDTGTPEAPTVTLSSDDADNNVAESAGTVTITATLSEAATPAAGVTVSLTAQPASTAEAGAAKDYTLAGTITVAQGATTGTATLTIRDDSDVEAHETLVLSAAADSHTAGADLTVTITDNDTAAKPTGVTVTAGDAQLDLTWTAPAGVLTGYDVHYTSAPKSGAGSVTDDAAVRNDSDDTAGWVDATHTGLTASHSITSLTNDTDYRIRIRAQSAAGAGAWTHDTGTPEAPPLPTVTLSSDDADDNVAESAGTVTITATLSEAATPASGVTVTVTREAASTAEAGAGKDYTLAGTITVAQGATTGTATLTVNDDTDVEAHETLVLRAAADGHTAGADLTITIIDDDLAAKPTGVTVTAADTQLDLAWTAPDGVLSGYDVHYTSASDTVAVPDDAAVRTDSDDTAGWVDATHTGLTASHSITSLTNDTTYRVRIRAQSAAGSGAWEHDTGTPEAPPLPTVTLSSDDADDNVAESVGTVTITATLSEAATPAGGVTVTVTREAASTAEAGAGKDYTLAGTITVAQGATTGTTTLTVNDDSDVEAHETLTLSAAADGHTAGADLTVTITDNDTAAKPTGVTVTAGDAQLDLTWTAPTGVLTGYDVHYTSAPKSGAGSVTDDAAVRNDSDDTAGWVDASHTGTTASHSITSLTNDTDYRIRIRATSAAGAGAWEHGTGTPEAPTDDGLSFTSDTETTVTVSGQVFAAAAYSVTEGDTVTVELRLPAAETEAVRFQMVPDYDSVADFYTDYSIGDCPRLDPNDDTITDEERAEAANCKFGVGYVIAEIPTGETSFTYEIRTEDDDEVEGDESFTLNIFPMSWNADLGGVPKAVVTIVDNDMAAAPGVVVTLPDVVVDGVTQTADKVHTTEGSSGTYTIVLASQPESWVRIYPESAMPCKVSIRDRGFVEFTPRNWDIPQTVYARAWLDYDAADEETVITHRLEAPHSPSYQTVTRDPVTNEVTDTTDLVSIDQVTVAAADKHPAGVMVVTGIDAADETHADLEKKIVTDLALTTGSTTGYLVYPNTEPSPIYGPNPADCYDYDTTRTITVTATSSDPDVVTVSPASVTFGPGIDYTPITFTVTATGVGTAEITHSTTTSSDPDYAAITIHKTVTVTVTAPQQNPQDPPSGPQHADPPVAVQRPDNVPPGPVHDVAVTADTPDSLTVTWSPPTTGDAPTRYVVHLKPRGGGKGWTKTIKARRSRITFDNLEAGTTYRLFIRAQNKAGKGPRTHTRITLPRLGS